MDYFPGMHPTQASKIFVKRSIATCLFYQYKLTVTCLFYQYKVTVTCHRMLMTLKNLFCDGRCDGETCQLMIVGQIAWIVWRCVTNSFLQTSTHCSKSSLLYPFPTASAERTFSAMKLLKMYLRPTLSDENMLGLALAFNSQTNAHRH